MASAVRAYWRVVRMSSLKTMHSAFLLQSTEEGWMASVCPVAMTLYVPAQKVEGAAYQMAGPR